MNTYLAATCLLAVVAAVAANPTLPLSYVPITTIEHIPSSNYGFNYAVNDPHTGDNKAQWETREGDVVRGAYSLVEPDGNIRVVEYRADPLTGFNAVVKRSGPNVHSIGLPISAPVITKPIHEPIAEVIHPAPIMEVEAPIVHQPIITPVIDTPPVIAPVPVLDHLPYFPLPAPGPWVHLSGSSYGHKGHIVRRWAAGPISLHGKTLTIKTKHH